MSDAKRFGGAHSPRNARREAPKPAPQKPASRFSGRKAKSFSWRVLGLYLAPAPLALAGLDGMLGADLFHILWSWGGFAVLMLAAWLTGQGMKAEAAYNDRIIAKPPAFPRKLVAAVLTGLAIFGASWMSGAAGLPLALFYGVLAAGAHVTAFGLDPMRAKGVDGIADAELDRVAAKLDEAEAVVAETVAAADKLGDRALTDRIDRLAFAARDILKEIQSDPRDMRRSRKFLSVHLVGLRDATVKFAVARSKGAGADQRDEYEGLLADLEQSFTKQRESLLIDDQTDLEVEIEVLRDRLKQEGAL